MMLVCGNGGGGKHQEHYFVVLKYLLFLTVIQEQMAEAVSWVVRPQPAGSR